MDKKDIHIYILDTLSTLKQAPIEYFAEQLNLEEDILIDSIHELIEEGLLEIIDSKIYFREDENPQDDSVSENVNENISSEVKDTNIDTVPNDTKKIFISYARRDSTKLAKELFNWLSGKGFHPFFDKDPEKGIPVGDPHWDAKIEIKIIESQLIIILLTPCSVRMKSFCRKEILFAQRKDVPIIPVTISDVDVPITIITTQCIEAFKNPTAVFEQLEFYIDYVIKNGTMPYRETGNSWWEAFETINFDEEIKGHDEFVGRDWLFEIIEKWVNTSKDKVLLLTADPGFGKSALVTHSEYIYNVKGVHFCISSKPESCHPNSWLKFLIKQLAIQFEPYKESIEPKKPNWNLSSESLFRTLISDPLLVCRNQIQIDDYWIFVIDGLDESFSLLGTEFVDLIAVSAKRIPEWVRLIVTSRSDTDIIRKLCVPGISHIPINSENENNFKDIRFFIEKKVEDISKVQIIENKQKLVNKIFEVSAGNFLLASVILDAMLESNHEWRLTHQDLESLTQKIDGLYELMFEKRFSKKSNFKLHIGPLIDCLIAAQAPIPKNILLDASGLDYKNASYSLNALSQFLIFTKNQNYDKNKKQSDFKDFNYTVRIFHKSFTDWLAKSRGVQKGHYYLAKTGYRQYTKQEENFSRYWYAYLPYHLLQSKMYDETIQIYQDPTFFNNSWNLNEFSIKSNWVKIEKNSHHKLIEVYQSVLQNPFQYPKEYILNIAKLISDLGYSSEAIRLKEYIVSKYQKEHDKINLIPIMGELAYDLYLTGEIDQAWKLMIEQESLCKELHDTKNLQICFGRQGNILHDRGMYEEAIKKYKEQERICLQSKDTYWLQKSYGNQGIIHLLKGDLLSASEYFKRQEDICRKIRHMAGLQTSIGNQGIIEYTRGNFDSALNLFQEQQAICEDIGYLRGLHKSLGNQGNIYQIQRKYNKALALFEKEEQICTQINDIEGLQVSIGHLANLKSEIGNLDDALELYKKQENFCKKLHNCEWYQICLGRQAVVHREKGELDIALSLFERQEKYCKKYEYSESLQKCLGNIGIIFAMKQEYEDAIKYFTKQKEICIEKNYPIGLQQAIGNIAITHYIQGKKDLAKELFHEQEKICRDISYEIGLNECLKNLKKLED